MERHVTRGWAARPRRRFRSCQHTTSSGRASGVSRPAEAVVGKVLPTQLTPLGRRRLAAASAAVRSVEVRMLGGLSPGDRAAALTALRSMIRSLREGAAVTPPSTGA